jgi:flagellar basal-body rod protein FlgC
MSLDVMAIAASGLHAQRIRMQAVSANLANMQTTRGPDGGPYRRQVTLLRAAPDGDGFASELEDQRKLYAVRVEKVTAVNREPIWTYDPDHPDADERGYVAMPNINLVEEMTDMMNASRSYEANLAALQAAKNMSRQAIDLARG